LNIENLEKWAKVKGLDLLGTGDFTHPQWLREIKENLNEKNGILYTESGFKFVLSSEVSLNYNQGKERRVHLLVIAPSFKIVDRINAWLDTLGRRDYDGRPIFRISCEDFVKKISKISEYIEVIPAHIWTPWFGLLGSESGFDSLEEAFGSQTSKIHAIETGLSSDPEMNLRLNQIKNKTIVSFSDSHSFWPWRLGREATIFSSINSYKEILEEIRENKIIGTIEVDPAYGKYHFDGHRNCNFSCSPEKTKELNGICPVCKKHLTLGVSYRVNELADVKGEVKSKKIVYKILPLHEIISSSLGTSINSKKVWTIYNKLIERFKNELNVLLKVEKKELLKVVDTGVADLILKNRDGKIKVKPGYDGVYGEMIKDWEEQRKLF